MAFTREHTRGHTSAHTRDNVGAPIAGGGTDPFGLTTEAGLQLKTEASADLEREH